MPRRKAPAATFVSMIDPNSDDDFAQTEIAAMMPTPDSADDKRAAATAAAAKRRPAKVATAARTKPAGTKSASAAASSKTRKVASSTTAAAAKKQQLQQQQQKKRGRPALKDLTNVTEEEDDDEDDGEEEEEAPQRKRAKGAMTAVVVESASKRKPARPVATTTSRLARAGSAALAVERNFEDETQAEPSIEMPDEEIEVAAMPVQSISRAVSRSVSRQPELLLSRNRRAGSASSTERGVNDPALRRRLGEMTNKYESLEIKYNSLKDVASAEAQSNFDKLKSSTELRAKNQDNIIASLRKELAAQQALAAETKTLRTQLASFQADNERLTGENKNLKSVQAEVKTLQAKLASTRAQSESTANSKAPLNAANSKSKVGKLDDATAMRMKEDLYGDLTGLMIHSVKRVDGEDVFDCIQTGRNGTLRFNLSIEDPTLARTPGTSYDEVQMTYTPLLDDKNDKHLVDILEDFLVEDICFPRNHAQGFYTKVRECMVRRVEIEE